MNLRSGAVFLSSLNIQGARWLVPAEERAEWTAEWKAEIWHAAQELGDGSLRDAGQLVQSSLGAYSDAYWLRRNRLVPLRRRFFHQGSASRCSVSLAAWACASLLLCWLLPGASNVMRHLPRPDRNDLVMISRGGYSGAQSATIAFDEFHSWETSARHLFSDFAFYQPVRSWVQVTRHPGTDLSIGHSTSNLFSLLKLPVPAPSDSHAARLFLTQSAWQERFARDPRVIGNFAEVAGQRIMIAGIVDQSSVDVPGQVDAWLLEDQSQLAKLPEKSTGFVLARLRKSGTTHQLQRWQSMTVRTSEGGSETFDCISLSEQDRLPFSIFFFTLIVALMALPATTPLPLGEYPRHSGHLPWTRRARRWVFLWSKILLLLPLVHFMAIDAAYGHAQSAVTAQYIQLTVSFFGFLFGFRWILQDQRKRCPVCLRVLSNPARVGEASRNFLAWNGTELICAGGHGLLHIPEHPTSWFGTQRWLELDASWGTLFSEGYVPRPGLV
jgi:hypothetical protein